MMLQGATEHVGTQVSAASQPWSAEWQEVDRRLRAYARQRATLDAAELFDLVRAEQLKVYFVCGHVSIYEYMERVLGYQPHAAHERMRVARSLSTLPETAAALARGELVYSAVRELTRVATAETEADWLGAARGLAVSQIEQLVSGHQAGDRPEDPTHPDLRPRVVRLELPPDVYALWRQARMVVATERGGEIVDADFVETLCRSVITPGSGASGPAHQISYQQCADCRRATQNGAGREIDVGPEVLERASCDAREIGSLDEEVPARATTTVTPRVREQVFARDHHRCTVPGCRSARNLEVHHIIEQSRGGGHEISNLTLLCTGHHTALHTGLLTMSGEAPYDIKFQWAYGPPMPVGLEPEARKAMTRQWIEDYFSGKYSEPGSPDEADEADGANEADEPDGADGPTWDPECEPAAGLSARSSRGNSARADIARRGPWSHAGPGVRASGRAEHALVARQPMPGPTSPDEAHGPTWDVECEPAAGAASALSPGDG